MLKPSVSKSGGNEEHDIVGMQGFTFMKDI